MSEKRGSYIKFSLRRRRTLAMARELVKLERQFTVELNNAVLPCGEKISLAKYISHYDRTRLMMQTKGFAEFIPLSNCEYVARMIDAYNKIRG